MIIQILSARSNEHVCKANALNTATVHFAAKLFRGLRSNAFKGVSDTASNDRAGMERCGIRPDR